MSNLTNQPFVRLSGGDRLITTSLAIANHFNKRHKNILRDIEKLECSEKFRRLNFEPIFLKDQYRRDLRAYEITRDGFVFLVMGFTGHQASIWKEKYIQAFNQLEQQAIEAKALEIPAFVKKALLNSNPRWKDILRYKNAKLTNIEIAKLLGISKATIALNLRKMEALQLIKPPKNLAKSQAVIAKNRQRLLEVQNAE